MENLKKLSEKDLIEIEGGWLFDGVEWWDGSGSNPVVGAANAAYNAGVIGGNIFEMTTALGAYAIDSLLN